MSQLDTFILQWFICFIGFKIALKFLRFFPRTQKGTRNLKINMKSIHLVSNKTLQEDQFHPDGETKGIINVHYDILKKKAICTSSIN